LNPRPLLSGQAKGQVLELAATGSWTAEHANLLEKLLADAVPPPGARAVTLDITAIGEIDTIGAWLIERNLRLWRSDGRDAQILGISDRNRGLFAEVHDVNRHTPEAPERRNGFLAFAERTGRTAGGFFNDILLFLGMFGAVSSALLRVLIHPRSFRFTSTVYHLYRIGWQAVPIIILITFLMGAIIAQQGFFHFRRFGADAYVVDLVGILVLREIGVLIVAIMVAGRSGSAYTAEIGTMKMREEIDALRTMGFDPVEVLILPRVLAIVIALPILTFIGSIAALYGGGLVAWFYGGMSPAIFIERLHEAISLTHFKVGILKSPFMALVIGIVACTAGLQVKGSAESLGLQTTGSVVKTIFLVIVLDGLFAVFFASIGM
jgi:phospholipid/cholesterol/gamma-HCH transport system permease protein